MLPGASGRKKPEGPNIICVYSYKDTAFLLILSIVKTPVVHIIALLLCVFKFQMVKAQESLDSELERYEQMCEVCLELKARMSRGEPISREEAKSTIDFFVTTNKRLKSKESEMTSAQRQRFRDVGQWFSTGIRPQVTYIAEVLPIVECSFPSRLTVNDIAGILIPQQDPDVFPSARLWKYRTDFILLAEMSAPDLSYGLRAGVKGRTFGGYLAFRSNFVKASADYSCHSDGTLENGSTIWPGGAEKTTSFIASAGFLAQTTPWLILYAGAGYGNRQLLWQDIDGGWAQVSDWSVKGLEAETGAMFRWNRVAFSAGVSTVRFRTCSATVGIGFYF